MAMSRNLLSATSALALIVGLGGPSWACPILTGTIGGFTNTGTVDCFNFNNATVTSGVSNSSTGVIGSPASPQPGSVNLNNTTINGSLQNSGRISASGGTPAGINVTGGSVVTNGIINNKTGTIGVNASGSSAFGIHVNQSSFSGNITNNGVISVTNSSGSAVGIAVGGTGGSGPAPIKPTSLNTSASSPTGGVTTLNPKNRHKH